MSSSYNSRTIGGTNPKKSGLTCVGLVWRPGLALEPVVEPVCASGFARARARASRQCHVGRRQVHSVLHLGKTEILNSQIFDIMGSEPGDQGQGIRGPDLVQCIAMSHSLNWSSVFSSRVLGIRHALKRGALFCFMKTF